jgi:hypothetical protein
VFGQGRLNGSLECTDRQSQEAKDEQIQRRRPTLDHRIFGRDYRFFRFGGERSFAELIDPTQVPLVALGVRLELAPCQTFLPDFARLLKVVCRYERPKLF